MFDSLDDCLPIDSIERLSIEKNHLGKEIKNVLNYDNSSSRYNEAAARLSWQRTLDFFSKHLK